MKHVQLAEFDYFFTPDGQQFNLHDAYDRWLLGFTGWGMPPIEYITQRAPQQHGETVIDFRLRPRTVQYTFRQEGCSRMDYWNNRGVLIDHLRPNRQTGFAFNTGKLRKILPDGSRRDLDVVIESGPVFAARSEDTWDEFSFTESLRFRADDPTIYDPELQSANWVIATTNNLVFPASFSIVFGASVINSTLSVTYTGTWLAYPIITMTGPLEVPIIENQTTGEKIALSYNIDPGEVVTVSLGFGQKTVVSNTNGDVFGTVTTDSDIATFHLAPAPEAPGGVNDLYAFGGGGIAGETEISVAWYTRYIGI